MTVSVADIDRWDAGDVREVFHATRSRAEAAFEAANGIAALPAFGSWGGTASDAAKTAIEATRKDLDAHGNEALAVSRAASVAAEDIEQVKNDLAALRDDAEKLGMAIDAASSTVVAGPGTAGAPPMETELKREQLQARLDAILAEAASADAKLSQAINMASGKTPIPSQSAGPGEGTPAGTGQPGQPISQQSSNTANPSSSTDFLNQLRNEMSQPGSAGVPPTSAPALDPSTPAGKAAADQMRKLLQEQGVPADQIDGRIADVFARAQQPLPAPPKPEPPTRQPAPGLGEQLGDAFNDFTNEVHEGFYDRLDQTVDSAEQTLHTAQNLTGTGGEGRPGVMDSWKQVFEDNAKSVMSDPLRAMAGPGNPLAEFGAVPGELSQAIDNPGHYVGEKLFDGTAMAATAPLGGEGALGRALFPELRAVEHGAIPEVGALPRDVTPGIPHNVIDVPPANENPLGSPLAGDHGLPPVMDHHGDLTHVNAESGGTGAWNHELNNPAPLTHYNVDDRFSYTTDANSRVGHAEMTYDHGHEPGDRNGYQQRIAGGDDRLPGDHGGHIFGTQFGGPGEAINITAMRDTLNAVGARDYYNLEMQWRALAEQGSQVQVKVDMSYPESSLRPDTYTVKTYVDGQLNSTYHFDN